MAIVAIVGRPNVGKSTLFNRLGRSKLALVDDFPGVTRDRNYAQVTWDDRVFTIIDTGGFVAKDQSIIEERARDQIMAALDEADIILFVTDAKAGIHPEDTEIANLLRRTSKPVFCAVNKIDGPEQTRNMNEFYELGLERFYPISSAHGFGIGDLMEEIAALIEPETIDPEAAEEEEEQKEIRVSVIGRPNAGKSTLVNRILGEERVIVSPIPGTTRDAVDTPFTQHGQRYVLIDTAGIRRKGRTHEKLEKISIIKALQSVERSHVAVLVLDATEGVTDQDMHIAGYIQERYRGLVVAVNKWDAVEQDTRYTKAFLADLKDRLRFMPFAPIITISAIAGKRVSKIMPTVREVFKQYNQRVTTGVLNRALEQTLQRHQPPEVGGRRLKFYYATQASVRPPTFVLFCNYPDSIHFSYKRFLTNQFRESFGLDKTPIRITFRGRKRDEA
ncbi:MAG: ribosome biogenesis GTPase Der [Acidobacteriota bacterium]